MCEKYKVNLNKNKRQIMIQVEKQLDTEEAEAVPKYYTNEYGEII